MADNFNLSGLDLVDNPAQDSLDLSGLLPIGEENGSPPTAPNIQDAGHTPRMLAGDLLRAPVSGTLGIVDAAARLPTWAYNTLRPDSLPAVDYPPSLNGAVQGKLDNYLPTPQNPQEQNLSAGMRNAMFGVPGVIGGMVANGIQQQPIGQENINIAGRDLGVSPNDIASNAAGLISAGALSPKPLVMGNVADSEAGRLAKINMEHNIPVYPTDVLPPTSAIGGFLNFMNATPLSGKEGRGAEQSAALGRGATGAIGEDSPVITPPVMNMAYNRISKTYEDFGNNNDVTPQAGTDIINKIGQLQNGPWATLGEDVQKRLQAQIDNNFVPKFNNNYSIDGSNWHKLQSGLGADARSTTDPEYSNALYDMQQIVRGGMRQSLPPAQMAPFDAANAQYRAMLALEKSAKAGLGTGQVSPSALLSGVSKIYPDTIYNDPSTLPQLAQSSQLLKQAQASSDKFNLNLHRQPFEAGQIAALAATPIGAVLNRTMNTALTPLDFSNPYGAGFGRTLQGLATSNSSNDEDIPHITIHPHAHGGFISNTLNGYSQDQINSEIARRGLK